jgi:hypothetical protein
MKKLNRVIFNVALYAVLQGVAMTSLSSNAFAQRGSMDPGNPSSFTNPTQGFPGFFDTNMAEHGTLVVEWPPLLLPFIPMPSLAVDYGVSDTFTVGTNALVSTLPWLFGAKGISLKARTLVQGSATSQSVATVYGGYLAGTDFSTQWQILTSNNAWKLAPKHIISAQAMFLNFGLEIGKQKNLNYTNLRFSSLSIGGGYQYLFSDTAALSTYVLAAAATSMEADTVAANLSADLNASSGQTSWGITRASLDLRSEDWVYSLGGAYTFGTINMVVPWLSATRRW